MGCGSSSLKGEKPQDLAGEQPQPTNMKRVQTNFSAVNFDGNSGGNGRGKSFAVAPDEATRPSRISEDPIPTTSTPADGIVADSTQARPSHHESPSSADPTSAASKAAFASSNEPVHQTGAGEVQPTPELSASPAGDRKKSWYARYQDNVSGRNKSQISDEELQKVFGMTREEWNAWVADPRNGVGPHQVAAGSAMGWQGGGGF